MTANNVEVATTALFELLSDRGALLNPLVDQQVQVQISTHESLREVAKRLAQEEYYLVTVVANDERELEDRQYKIYYVFSHPEVDLFAIVEYLLGRGSTSHYSIVEHFPAIEPFEREIQDMLGLSPAANAESPDDRRLVPRGSWLHNAFPPGLFPLRRTDTIWRLRERAAAAPRDVSSEGLTEHQVSEPRGESLGTSFPVGPIHAGIIESGQFWFSTSGEAIEDLRLQLGFVHRGIERMFQSGTNLIDGWRLAEQVSGDNSVAHSLAYCRAAEVLTDTTVPAPAELLRALFLELERIHNHIADLGGLAEDVGMDQFAAEFSVIREEILRLNKKLTGHRYLRAVNRVGGVHMTEPLDLADINGVLDKWIGAFHSLARAMVARSGFRERAIRVGILQPSDALKLGVTGLAARASGIGRDTRIGHPVGAYRQAGEILKPVPAALGDDKEAVAGDVFARALTRAREVLASRRLIEWLVHEWSRLEEPDRRGLITEPRILPENNYTSAIGHAEGFRGDVVYWLMQDKMSGIYRCKVRDPSMLNWPAMRVCALPRHLDDGMYVETLIADFPLLNKSFSLSYAGNDL